MILYFTLVLDLGLFGSWCCDWYLGFPKVHKVMDQSMLEEESDDAWMFSGSSDEEDGMSQLFLSFFKEELKAKIINFSNIFLESLT